MNQRFVAWIVVAMACPVPAFAAAADCGPLSALLQHRAAAMKQVSTWKDNHPYVATACFTLVDLEKDTAQIVEEIGRLGPAASACKVPANGVALLKGQLADITKARLNTCGFHGRYQNELVKTPRS